MFSLVVKIPKPPVQVLKFNSWLWCLINADTGRRTGGSGSYVSVTHMGDLTCVSDLSFGLLAQPLPSPDWKLCLFVEYASLVTPSVLLSVYGSQNKQAKSKDC